MLKHHIPELPSRAKENPRKGAHADMREDLLHTSPSPIPLWHMRQGVLQGTPRAHVAVLKLTLALAGDLPCKRMCGEGIRPWPML